MNPKNCKSVKSGLLYSNNYRIITNNRVALEWKAIATAKAIR